MHISINTAEPLSDLDQQILMMLISGEVILPEVGEAEPEKPAAKKAAPAKKAAAKKPEPKPEPEPEPMAEEPVEEEEVFDEPEETEEEQSDEDLLSLAVKKATKMVASGQAEKVREALDAAGANRVRELNTDNVREFFKALS